jgi:hypothetical protein
MGNGPARANFTHHGVVLYQYHPSNCGTVRLPCLRRRLPVDAWCRSASPPIGF